MQVFNHRLTDGKPINMGYYLSGNKESKLESVSKIDGVTIFEAALKGNMATVASFLLGGVDPNVTERDGERGTPLHYAAKGGEQLVVRFLVDNGAFVDSAAGNGSTPLMWGAKANHPDVCIGLLASGAKPGAADDHGMTLAMHAASNPPILHILRSKGVKLDEEVSSDNKMTLLHRAAMNTDIATSWGACLYLTETGGIDVNLQDASGRTAVHYACAANDIDGVKALMSKGGNNTTKDNAGHIPTQVPTCRSSPLKKFVNAFMAETSTAKQAKLAQRDFSNYAALDLKQVQHFSVAFFLPNTAVLLAAYIPTWIGIFSLAIFAIGFGMVAKFSMARKVRSMATAGWFSGALFYGSGILINKVFPVYLECHENHIAYYLWWFFTIPMFIAYAWAVLKDPGVVQSTAEARAEIYDGVASAGEGEIQRMGYDLTSMVRKPLRSKHCSKTGQCVARFDHFCVWTGNAIGGGNHRQFVIYCLCQALAQMLVGHICYSWMFVCTPKLLSPDAIKPEGLFGWIEWLYRDSDHSMVTFFLLTYNSFVLLFVSTVLLSQMWYATRNVTSNEVWFASRYRWMIMMGTRAHSMYDKGCLQNLIGFFFTDNLVAVEYTVPPMNDHLKKLSRRYAAGIRAASEAAAAKAAAGGGGGDHGHSHNGQECDGSAHGHSHGGAQPLEGQGHAHGGGYVEGDDLEGGAHNGGGGGGGQFDYASAMNSLPQEAQDDLAHTQVLLQDLIMGKPLVQPSEWDSEKWERISTQAQSMHTNYQNAMAGISQAPVEQVSSPSNPQPTRRKQD